MNNNMVLETEVDYTKRQFKFNQEMFKKYLKESWGNRVHHISLLMDHKVRHNFLSASKRRQKKMIEHMRGFMVHYHVVTGEIAPCTQKHNGPYLAKKVTLVEKLYPTAVIEPIELSTVYTPKEGDVILKMHFNDPDAKPEICVASTGNGVEAEVIHVVQDGDETGLVVKMEGKCSYLSGIKPAQTEQQDCQVEELSVTFTGGPQHETPGSVLRIFRPVVQSH